MVKPGDTIVHSGPLYAATETLIARVLGKFGVHFLDFPAGASRAEIDAELAKANSGRSEEHTSELQSLMRISYAVFCLKKKKEPKHTPKNYMKKYIRINTDT